MLDKLEIRVPATVSFRPEFREMYCELAEDPKGPFRKRGPHYALAGDLRAHGYEVILHVCCMHRRRQKFEFVDANGKDRTKFLDAGGNHKLEFLDTGKRGFSFLLGECMRIFDIDPLKCGVMRVDCAADVPGVGVPWFHQRTRVRWKQFASEIGVLCMEPAGADASLVYAQMGKREVQTLYFGKRPNYYRIYDKVAQWRAEYLQFRGRDNSARALVKRTMKAGATPEDIEWQFKAIGVNPDADDCIPSFEEIYGISETGYTLTRCERQIGGGQVPTIPVKAKPSKEWERLDTVVALKKRLADYNPYQEFEIVAGGQPEPARENYSVTTYMAGMYLRDRIQREGIQQTRAWLNSHRKVGSKGPGRNAQKLLGTYADFIPVANDAISTHELYERYRNSLLKQLAA